MPCITNENVEIWTLYASITIALVGFIFNAVSLWQTKKATEDMAKPYLNVFVDVYAIKNDYRVYVFKNFGTTPAYIDDIEIFGELDSLNQKLKFKSLIGNMLAPGQSITSTIEDGYHGTVTMEITYHDQNQKTYKESFKLDADAYISLAYKVPDSKNENDTASAIRQSTAALIRDRK